MRDEKHGNPATAQLSDDGIFKQGLANMSIDFATAPSADFRSIHAG